MPESTRRRTPAQDRPGSDVDEPLGCYIASPKRRVGELRAAFPDLHFTVEDEIAEGDKVCVRYRFEGTHAGAFRGVPPTRKRIAYSGILIYRILNNKIAEQWTEVDLLGFLEQLGALPP